MRGRFLIAGGGVVVLGLLGLLWQATRDVDAAEVTVSGHPDPSRATSGDAAQLPMGRVVRDPSLPSAIAMSHPTAPEPSLARDLGGPPLAEGGSSGSAKPDPYKPRDRAIKNLLRKQVDAIDQYISDCVANSAKAGGKVTGVAQLTVAFRRGDRPGVAVVDVGVSVGDTTMTDQPLLDCLSGTGRHMQLEIPDGVTDVDVKHEVSLDAGTLTNHKLSAFQVHVPGDPPTPVAPEPVRSGP